MQVGMLHPSKLDDLVYQGFGKSDLMKVKCSGCNEPPPDDNSARWAMNDPTRYVVRTSSRISKVLRTGCRAIPQDAAVPFVVATRQGLLTQNHRETRDDWQHLVRTETSRLLPAQVVGWCILCKEHKEMSDPREIRNRRAYLVYGGNRVLDVQPRWTVGDPAKFTEREGKCNACSSGKNICTSPG